MTSYDFTHLTFVAVGGKIEGRTNLQKTVYLLGAMTDVTEMGYKPHYYGPYSSEVAGSVDELRSLGFITQQPRGVGAVDAKGFEVSRYDYSMTRAGKSVASQKTKREPRWPQIKRAGERFAKVTTSTKRNLAIAAKVHYLMFVEGEKRRRVLPHLAVRSGWTLTEDDVASGIKLLEELGLIESDETEAASREE